MKAGTAHADCPHNRSVRGPGKCTRTARTADQPRQAGGVESRVGLTAKERLEKSATSPWRLGADARWRDRCPAACACITGMEEVRSVEFGVGGGVIRLHRSIDRIEFLNRSRQASEHPNHHHHITASMRQLSYPTFRATPIANPTPPPQPNPQARMHGAPQHP